MTGRVVVVTGGGGGIGAAVAEELGRQGDHVVTLDPLVTLDGAEQLPAPEETTAGRIVAAGGSARATSVSVTDGEGVRALFDELVVEHGRLDAVVNVAGISRPTSFTGGSEDDWRAVLEVHLDGYGNVLAAALPLMAAAGRGRILGVTSGSGWRAADAGAYACAKRAVAALTWQLGRQAPSGVVVNAMSPIAVTRMVTAALGRTPSAAAAGGGASASSTGGLSLGSMPQPEDLGPLGAHLVGEDVGWCSGQVLFAGGSEVAVVEAPRLLEVVRTDGAASLPHLLDAVVPGALAPAEAQQTSGGGGNPRFGAAFQRSDGAIAGSVTGTCVVVTDRPEQIAPVTAALEARGATCHAVAVGDTGSTFAAAAGAVRSAAEQVGGIDAVVVALAGGPTAPEVSGWERILAEHDGLVPRIHADAAWARAVVDEATATGRPIRLVTLTDATTSGGGSRAQAAAQLARSSRRATEERVAAFAVAVEVAVTDRVTAELVAHLVCHPEAVALSGAELAVGPGWVGVRSHPRPTGSISLGAPELPAWFDGALRRAVGGEEGR